MDSRYKHTIVPLIDTPEHSRETLIRAIEGCGLDTKFRVGLKAILEIYWPAGHGQPIAEPWFSVSIPTFKALTGYGREKARDVLVSLAELHWVEAEFSNHCPPRIRPNWGRLFGCSSAPAKPEASGFSESTDRRPPVLESEASGLEVAENRRPPVEKAEASGFDLAEFSESDLESVIDGLGIELDLMAERLKDFKQILNGLRCRQPIAVGAENRRPPESEASETGGLRSQLINSIELNQSNSIELGSIESEASGFEGLQSESRRAPVLTRVEPAKAEPAKGRSFKDFTWGDLFSEMNAKSLKDPAFVKRCFHHVVSVGRVAGDGEGRVQFFALLLESTSIAPSNPGGVLTNKIRDGSTAKPSWIETARSQLAEIDRRKALPETRASPDLVAVQAAKTAELQRGRGVPDPMRIGDLIGARVGQ